VQELARYDGPNQFLRRIARRPMALGGRSISPGDVLYAGVAAANRDPARWGPDAGELRIDRPDAAQHVQFGGGTHHCLGHHLGRLQVEVALGAAVARLDDLALAGEPVWNNRMVLRSLRHLPVTYTAGGR